MQSPGLALARPGRASTALARRRRPHRRPGLRRRTAPFVASCRCIAFATDRIETVRSRKTIYVRFDLNDYSIPPEAVGRPLTLVASDITVRILDGSLEIARHARSYDRHQLVLDPAHQEAVLKIKRKAFHSTPGGRLEQAVPESKTLLDLAFAAGRIGRQLRPPNCSNCWSSMAPPRCAAPSSKRCNATPHAPLPWLSCCAAKPRSRR